MGAIDSTAFMGQVDTFTYVMTHDEHLAIEFFYHS